MQNPLFFVALVPDPETQEAITAFKLECAQLFKAKHALKTMPHITLKAPFRWPIDRLEELKTTLSGFAAMKTPFHVHLDGFGCFPPRVIYVDIVPNELLQALKRELDKHLSVVIGMKSNGRNAFHPHVTIAHRDLAETTFPKAWGYFSQQSFNAQFTVKSLVLLQHQHGKWEVEGWFAFGQ